MGMGDFAAKLDSIGRRIVAIRQIGRIRSWSPIKRDLIGPEGEGAIFEVGMCQLL